MKELKKIANEHKATKRFLYFSGIMTGAIIIGQAYFFVTIVDRVFLKGHTLAEIIPYLIGLLLVLFARALFTYLNGRAGVKMASKVKRDFRIALLTKFSRNPVQASLTGQSGQKVSVMMDAVDEIDSYFSKYIPQMIQTSIVPIMILIAVFTQHVYTGLIMLVTAPFIPLFMIIFGEKTKKKSEEQLEKLTAFSGRFLDTLQGLTTLKLFGRAKQQKESIHSSSIGFREATMEVLKIAFLSSLMLEFISMLSIGLIALEVGLRLVVFQSVTFFAAFFVLVLAPEFYLSLKELGSAFHTGRGSMAAAKKVTEELEETEKAVEWGEASLASTTTPPTILLRHTGFRYREDGFALKNIHADIRPYKQIAIVGRSGAGKTTLLHLIAGLVPPTEGELIVDGRPLSDYKENDWFNQLSYISQQPYLFSGTIAENIAIGGKADASREEIEEAAKKAGIIDMIQSLENGFDTVIGEAGRGLSGGEKQRIAIARAFLKRPSVILFDEPTTGLDLYTEQILQASMKELSKSSTVITVAHRLHTIKKADKIMFLENGEMVAQGTHAELIESVPEYRNMVTVQQGGDAS
ncbi:thiol reductant ABC exporter subunit CydD [Halalkalibacter nanhaiisediminis]|uniref:ATP-binding cassette subfamily C protein CydD n=1 Tax=Halalkalibacter nanhaiisediminis TaxID=688079 RepID=A0A562QS84_9BACI|nr:thiol reductant ABC exporter subunit CydD [Halalkalibacter nanhaiisediminis]TWI59050.1 ATP-binding cassette subfamily C protein CydD [Halalkalibacter nanhaiisediminis]